MPLQTNQRHQFIGAVATLGLCNTPGFQTKGNILPIGHQGKQGKILENQGCGAFRRPQAIHLFPADQHPAFAGINEPRNHAQDRGLPTS